MIFHLPWGKGEGVIAVPLCHVSEEFLVWPHRKLGWLQLIFIRANMCLMLGRVLGWGSHLDHPEVRMVACCQQQWMG